MLTVLVADIFGHTPELSKLAEEVAGQESLIIDAYSAVEISGQKRNFKNEQLAYDYFSNQIGLNSYALIVKKKLSEIKEPFNLIAFSVGGSAVWLNASMLKDTKVNRVLCFYASQIRHHITIQPSVAIELILPLNETHFDISELANQLKDTAQVTLHQSTYLHGFMNKRSENFNPLAYKHYIKQLSIKLGDA